MDLSAHKLLIDEIRRSAIRLTGYSADHAALLHMIGEAKYVLIGEATHGTEEFYHMRAELTKDLILYYGFAAVALEADWPDASRVNRYVRGIGNNENAQYALGDFHRFPIWMWRNEVMVEFVEWLRSYNLKKTDVHQKVGVYGLDLYSLYASIDAVIHYLDQVDPAAAKRARYHYSCFDHPHSSDPEDYGYAATLGLAPVCEHEVIQELIELQRHRLDYLKQNGFVASEDFFCAEQNAKLIIDAEKYYRTIFEGRVSSWNLRDRHMADTLFALSKHLRAQRQSDAKMVVWAHNSHIGDARATEMGTEGEWNIGQLVREADEKNTVLIGFSTYQGTVTASSEWGGPTEQKKIRPAAKESYEALFHETGLPDFMLLLRGNDTLNHYLSISRLQRAIGVLYQPETEHQSHYFFSKLALQYDAIIHFDKTHALKPLEFTESWQELKEYETYPAGL